MTLNIFNCVAYCADLFSIFIRDFDIKFCFKTHDKFNNVQ